MSADEISKAQERETLEQIMALIQKIGGDDSYVGMAMKGVYEVAISNIENDFGDSLAEQARGASSRAGKHLEQCRIFKSEAERASAEAEASKQLHKEAREAVEILQKEVNKARDDGAAMLECELEAQRKAESLEGQLHFAKQQIIELKAKLYDIMTKEEGET